MKGGDDIYKSALWYILADPAGIHSLPERLEIISGSQLLITETREKETKGGDFFWKTYGTYFSKQDIAILLDTIDYLDQYFKYTDGGTSGDNFYTQPGALELDKALMKVYGNRVGGQRSLAERSVVQQHAVNNYQDIIDNSIIATSEQMYNHVELLYPSGPDPTNNPNAAENKAFAYYSYDQDPDFLRSYQTYQKNLDPNIFIDKTAADNYTHVAQNIKGTNNKKHADDMMLTPHRVANQILMNVMRPMYQGTLTILGDPNIRPWDIVHIHDDMTEMYGPIEVEQVVTTISPTSGYTTTIVPNALIYHNNYGVTLDRNLLLLTQQMKTLLTIWTTIKWALTGVATGIAWRSLKVLGTNRLTKANTSIKRVNNIFGKRTREFLKKPKVARGKLASSFLKDLSKKERKIIEKHLTSAEISELELKMAQGEHNLSMKGRNKIFDKNKVKWVNGKRTTIAVQRNHAWRTTANQTVGAFIKELKVEYASNHSFWKKPSVRGLLAEHEQLDKMVKEYDDLSRKLTSGGQNGRPLSGNAKLLVEKKRSKLATQMNKLISDGSRVTATKIKILKNGKVVRGKEYHPGGRNTTMKTHLRNIKNEGSAIARRNFKKSVSITKKTVLAGLNSVVNKAQFGLKAISTIGWGLTAFELGGWMWDSYKLSAKTSILQANLLAGANQLTVLPLEHPAGKDYVAGLEGVIGTAAGSSQILWGFTSGSSINRTIRTQDMILQNMWAAAD